MFYEGDLQSGIALAVQQSKAVLCFVHGHSQKSVEWEDVLVNDREIHEAIAKSAVCLRLKVVSRETAFLAKFCPIESTPAIIVINNGTLQLNITSKATASIEELKEALRKAFLNPSTMPGQNVTNPTTAETPTQAPQPARLTETSPTTTPPSTIGGSNPTRSAIENTATPLSRLQGSDGRTHLPTHNRRFPGSQATTQPAQNQGASDGTTQNQQSQQREDYVKIQKEREQKARDERERIKQQIKSDREERRRVEQIRKQTEVAAVVEEDGTSKPPKSNDIRIQVRMFDGSTQRQSFPPSSTIANEVRTWIDSFAGQGIPYNLKIVLTPLPNRNIEAGEEEQPLTDIGIKGSCTLIMVPVKDFVDSYAEARPGLVGSAVSGGYNLVTGAAGMVLGGVKTFLGVGRAAPDQPAPANDTSNPPGELPRVRVRTLADQRAEAAKKDQQFYNGNQLNFQPRKDEDDTKDD